MTVLFDLDNTLYPEFSFVVGGMRAVARFLAARHRLDAAELEARLLRLLETQGRGRVFDRLLDDLGLAGRELPATLVYVYRTHPPVLRLYDGAAPLLERLRAGGTRLGLVTDGLASVQRSKIAALGLEAMVDAVVCTGELGGDAAKPSPVPFQVALRLLDAQPAQAVYVGDDDTKDFAGPHVLGMDTIQLERPGEPRLRTGPPEGRAAARRVVSDFAQLQECLMQRP